MKKIDIFLKYPWAFPDSPYYKYLLAYPPERINYVNVSNKEYDVLKKSSSFKKLKFFKSLIRGLLKYTPIFPIPSVKKGDYDFVHGAHCLIRNKEIAYVSDIEKLSNYTMTSYQLFNKFFIKKQIKRLLLRKNLKYILPWTETVKKEMRNVLGDDFYKKIEYKVKVIYPAVPLLDFNKKKHSSFNLLFISRYFYMKGGLYVCEVFKKLKKDHNINLFVIGDCPNEMKENYPEVDFIGYLPREEIISKYFPITDLFFYPGFSDSFGFAFLEAMSAGLPILTVDGYSRKEVVSSEVGIVLDRPENINPFRLENFVLLKQMHDSIENLIKNPKLLKKMSFNGKKEIVQGRFSLKKMNEDYIKIYEAVLK